MFLLPSNTKKIKHPSQSGFSLIELMVTIAIVTLITGIVMVKYGSFNSVVILKSQAYELALDIRTAQTYGVNAKGASDSYRGAYGIYFNVTSGNQNQYVLFQDQDGDRRFDNGEAIGETYTVDNRFQISDICTTSGGAADCSASQASVAFQRPDFDAHIWTSTSPSGDTQMDITLSVVNNPLMQRVVTIYSSGQISVN